MTPSNTELLRRVGARIRQKRTDLGLSIRATAERAGMSQRFVSDVEAGRGNIAIGRLSNLADALDVPLVSLIRPRSAPGPRQAIEDLLAGCSDAELRRLLGVLEVARGKKAPLVVALLGIRGSGKSTIGPRLADVLGLPFVELARRIEERARMSVGDVFSLHGEAYYRRLEQRCLTELINTGAPAVVALPGGIVGNNEAFELIRATCRSIWLRARVEDYWKRVFEQGDTRPMAGREDAMADLRALVSQREPLYRQADHIVETSGETIEAIVTSIVAALDGAELRA